MSKEQEEYGHVPFDIMQYAKDVLGPNYEAMVHAIGEAGRVWVREYLIRSGKDFLDTEELTISALMFTDLQAHAIVGMEEEGEFYLYEEDEKE